MIRRAVLIAGLALLATAGSGAATPSVTPVKGVVVGSQTGMLLVAQPNGLVRTVSGHAAVGARVSASRGHLSVLGRAHRALIRGVFVRHRGNLVFLSAAHHILVVRAGRHLASAFDAAPAPGTVVQETVGIDEQGNLDEESEQDVGETGQVQGEAVVAAVGAGTVTLTVNGQSLTIPLPAGLTLPASIVG